MKFNEATEYLNESPSTNILKDIVRELTKKKIKSEIKRDKIKENQIWN